MGLSLSLNPLTGFGLLDPIVEHASAKDLQHRGFDFDREMFDKSSAFAVEQFGRESDFQREMQSTQFKNYMDSIEGSSARQVKGLKAAGLNPILAATGGFKPQGVTTQAGTAKAGPATGGRGGGAKGASSRIGEHARQSSLIKSNVALNASAAAVNKEKEETERTIQYKNRADAKRSLAEADKTELQNMKRSFFAFFWEQMSGDLRRFDEAFRKWSDNNGKKIDAWLDSTGQSIIDFKNNLRKDYQGSTGGRNRRNR